MQGLADSGMGGFNILDQFNILKGLGQGDLPSFDQFLRSTGSPSAQQFLGSGPGAPGPRADYSLIGSGSQPASVFPHNPYMF